MKQSRLIKILLDPWFKYAKYALILSSISFLLLSPLSEYYAVIIPEKILTALDKGVSINDIILVGLKYFSLSLLFYLLSRILQDTVYEKGKIIIENKIKNDVINKLLLLDQEIFDKQEYYDSYKLVIEEYPKKSVESFEYIMHLGQNIIQIIILGSLIILKGSYIISIILLLSFCAMLAQILWSDLSSKKSIKQIRPKRKIDYVIRLFYDPSIISDIKINDYHAYFESFVNDGAKELINIQNIFKRKLIFIDALVGLSQIGINFVIPLYIAISLINNKISDISIFSTLLVAANSLKTNLNELGWWSSQISANIAYASKIQSFMNLSPMIENSFSTKKLETVPIKVDIQNLKYKYLTGNFQLKIDALHISPGEKVAIVGENGAGKSTLFKLLLRIYDAKDASIKLNGNDIKEIDILSLRNSIGYVAQKPILYSTSVKEYLQCNNDQVIKSVLNELRLNIDINAMLTKEFDDNGLVLSGGQSQLLALARVLSKKHSLLLLDEPSSALDPSKEELMLNIIEKNVNTTLIMIAHRLSSIRNMDRILVMSNGRIVENGTHDSLMRKRGIYYKMFNAQASRYN